MLTDPQITILAAAIAAETDPEFVGYRNSGATGAMAEWFNVASTFIVHCAVAASGSDINMSGGLTTRLAMCRRSWQAGRSGATRAIK